MERDASDCTWLFFDHDNWPQFESAFDQIRRSGFRAAYSFISIEHGFILRFAHCGRVFLNGEDALRDLNNL